MKKPIAHYQSVSASVAITFHSVLREAEFLRQISVARSIVRGNLKVFWGENVSRHFASVAEVCVGA